MTEPLPDTVVDNATKHAEHVAAEANSYEPPQPPQDAQVDDTPVLDGVTQSTTESDQVDDGVDMNSIPAFRDLRGVLPSKRFALQAQMMELVKDMPKEWVEGETKVDDVDVTELDFGSLSTLITNAENFVLDLAEDREEMTSWLMEQDNGMQAVMDAFGKATELVGN